MSCFKKQTNIKNFNDIQNMSITYTYGDFNTKYNKVSKKNKCKIHIINTLKSMKKTDRKSILPEDTLYNTECNICLSHYEIKIDQLRVLPCKHSFHTDCIDKWFEKKKRCPICNFDMEIIKLNI